MWAMTIVKLISSLLLATAGGSTCAMNSASANHLGCTVEGSEMLPAEIGGADGLCDAIRAAVAQQAGAQAKGGAVAVRVINPYSAVATVTAPGGRKFPDIEVSVSDRQLNPTSVAMLAREVARRFAPSQ